MSRPRKSTPQYIRHGQADRARAVWTDQNGVRHFRFLPGPFESSESRKAFGRLLLELEVSPQAATIAGTDGLLVVELLDAYLTHARRHYRGADGKPTSEMFEVKLVIKALADTYGDDTAAGFGPLKLKAVRQSWVASSLSRGEVNRRTNIVRRIFKWAAGEELIPATTYTALSVVTGLQKGRTTAREPKPIAPVADDVVNATLPFLNRHVRGLVEFQRLTGARPGEACALRVCDVDRTGDVWLFKPPHHKTAHKGKGRIIAIGPKAQALLAPFITDDPQAYLFNPALAVAEVRLARADRRKTPRYNSHLARNKSKRKKNPKRAPAGGYTYHSYGLAVSRACDLAFPLPADLAQRPKESKRAWWARLTPGEKERAKEWQKAHRWAPNRLRHTFATAVRKKHGLEAAQVVLGHERADVTQIYAEKNEAIAVKIAAEVG